MEAEAEGAEEEEGAEDREVGVEEVKSLEAWMISGARSVRAVVERLKAI